MFSGDIVIATSNPCACPLVSVGTFCFVNGRTFSIRRSSVPGSRQSSYVPRFFHYWFHWIHTRRAFLRVLNKELHGFIVLCMHIYLLLQNCVTICIMFPFKTTVPRRLTRTARMLKVSSEHLLRKGTLPALAKSIKLAGQSRWQQLARN